MRIVKNKITYKIYSKASSIKKELYSFSEAIYSSPYQKPEYIKMAIRMRYFYSLIRQVKTFFIVFSINRKKVLLMPLCKSFFFEKYFFFGDRAGFGYLDVIFLSFHILFIRLVMLGFSISNTFIIYGPFNSV